MNDNTSSKSNTSIDENINSFDEHLVSSDNTSELKTPPMEKNVSLLNSVKITS